jgi:hypothetical protein
MSRAHGFSPKAPIKKDKVIEILAPLWMRLFPKTIMDSSASQYSFPPDVEVNTFFLSAADLMQTLDAIDALCYKNEAMLPARWPVILEKLHGLKGDLKTLLIVRMVEAHKPRRSDGVYFMLVTVAMDYKLCMPH